MDTSTNRRLVVSLLVAGVSASATLAYGRLAVLSETPVIAAIQKAVLILLCPGVIGAIAVGGNVHTFELSVAAAINGLMYFAVAWLTWLFWED